MRHRPLTAAAAAVMALLLASCGSVTPAPSESPRNVSATASASPKVTTAPDDGGTVEPLTCETMIPRGTVKALKKIGWTFREQEFMIGETRIADGLMCTWADFRVPSDHMQIYARGDLPAAQAGSVIAQLERDGWIESVQGGTVYLTEDPSYALATDDEGFGMTYEFGDGWVRFADTKQGLLLIDVGR